MKTGATVAAFARPVRLRPVDLRLTPCPRASPIATRTSSLAVQTQRRKLRRTRPERSAWPEPEPTSSGPWQPREPMLPDDRDFGPAMGPSHVKEGGRAWPAGRVRNPRSTGNTHADRTVSSHMEAENFVHRTLTERGGTEWPAAACPAKSRISNPSRRASRATPSSSRRSRSAAVSAARCAIDCGQLDPGAVIRPEPGEWQPHMPAQLDDQELADWRAGRAAVYQLAALTVGTRIAVADA